MSAIVNLRRARTRKELALLLGFKPKALTGIVYKTADPDKYRTFKIPKKSGGTREISAPNESLGLLQRRLSDLLYDCLEEKQSQKLHTSKSQFGYIRDMSVVDNARRHRGKRHILNVDIEDFFGSINFGRVRGYFLSDSFFNLDEQVATTIAQIACYNNALPQGSPSSPVISSLIGSILDRRLSSLAREYGCLYTRYVDDLTFSTNAMQFPAEIAVYDNSSRKWIPGPKLSNAVAKAGFSLNDKTRLFSRTGRQTVTGLVVNNKVNVNRHYEMRVRAAFHRWYHSGTYRVLRSLEKSKKPDGYEIETAPFRLEGM